MLFFGIIAVFFILAHDWIYKYTNHPHDGGGGWMWSEDDGEPSKFILWLTRIAGVIIFIIGLYCEFK